MSASIRSSADGSQAIIAVNGADKLTVNTDGSMVATATPAVGDNTKKLATTEHIQNAIIGGAAQSLQDVAASRALNTVYTNTTGRAIFIHVCLNSNPNGIGFQINGVDVYAESIAYNYTSTYMFLVPAGATYKLIASAGTIYYWKEIR